MWITGGIMLDLTDRTFFYVDYSIRKHDALITVSRKMEAYPMMKLIEYGSLSNDDWPNVEVLTRTIQKGSVKPSAYIVLASYTSYIIQPYQRHTYVLNITF